MFHLNFSKERISLLAEKRILFALKEISIILSFAILTALFSKIKFEIGIVPITFQTLAVLLSGIFLGSRKGALSQLLYLVLGLLGIPWFSRGGGIIYLFSPTFGYILGFVFASFLAGFLFERLREKKIFFLFLILVFSNFSIYLFGLPWLNFFVHSWQKTLQVGFYPFIAGDLLKIILCLLLIYSSVFLKKVFKNFSYNA